MKRSLIDSAIADFMVAGARLPSAAHREMVEALFAAFIAQARAVGGQPDEEWIRRRVADLQGEAAVTAHEYRPRIQIGPSAEEVLSRRIRAARAASAAPVRAEVVDYTGRA